MGQSALGSVTHQTDPLIANDTVDEDGDGLVHYYNYAGYGQFAFAGIVQMKLPLVNDVLALQAGVKAGMEQEEPGLCLNQRQVLSSTLGIVSGENSWSRFMMAGGGYAGLKLNLNREHNVFKLSLEAGLDDHYGIGG